MISITYMKLRCVAILIITSLSSPIALTWVLSSFITFLSLLRGTTPSLLQMTKGMTLETLWNLPDDCEDSY
jgi:hypothetical protein